MLSKMFGSAKRKVGPVGLSLVAAALTATAFAAVSVAAKDDNGANKNKSGEADVMRAAPGPGGPEMFREDLSEEDRQALDEFKQCMDDNGAPAPPEPGERSEGDGPPEPPSEDDRAKIEKALEACEDKLPEGARAFGGPGGPGCGPPLGAGDSATIPAPPNGSSQGNQQSAPQSSGAAS